MLKPSDDRFIQLTSTERITSNPYKHGRNEMHEAGGHLVSIVIESASG
jgi:hypothetical protein